MTLSSRREFSSGSNSCCNNGYLYSGEEEPRTGHGIWNAVAGTKQKED